MFVYECLGCESVCLSICVCVNLKKKILLLLRTDSFATHISFREWYV